MFSTVSLGQQIVDVDTNFFLNEQMYISNMHWMENVCQNGHVSVMQEQITSANDMPLVKVGTPRFKWITSLY